MNFKRLPIVLGLLFSLTCICSAWNNGQTYTLRRCSPCPSPIFFCDSLHGWISGWEMGIHWSADGGSTWNYQNTGTPNRIQSIFFTDPNHGWAIADSGVVLRYHSSTWSIQLNRPNSYLMDILFTDSLHGFLSDNSILLATTDGGMNWSERFSAGHSISGIKFVDRLNGWIHTFNNPSQLFRTSDGGVTWDSCWSDTTFLYGMSFTDALHGWLIEYPNVILRTTDGGSSWSRNPLNYEASYIDFVDSLQGYLSSSSNGLYRTTDGGQNWNRISPNHSISPIIHYHNRVWATERSSSYSAYVLNMSDDGWQTVTSQSFSATTFFNSFAVSDPSVLWFAGPNGTILSLNENRGWSYHFDLTNAILNSITFPDSLNGWVVGSNGTIFHSSDAGNSWIQQYRDSTTAFQQIIMVDSLYGWCYGTNRHLLHTTDGGSNWTEQTWGSNFEIVSLSFANRQSGWLSDGSNFFQTIDGGNHWTLLPMTGNLAVQVVKAVSPSRVFAILSDGTLVVSNNGSRYWTLVNTDNFGNWIDVDFRGNVGCAIGRWGQFYYTTNSGTSWQELGESYGTTFLKVQISPDGGIWLLTSRSFLYYYDNARTWGVQFGAAPALLLEPLLVPNYPNPFNSSTTISYSLPTPGKVDLRVFDLQGREITTLHQGLQHAGSYKLNFNGNGLSSGSYFVRMNVGKNSQVRKIELVK